MIYFNSAIMMEGGILGLLGKHTVKSNASLPSNFQAIALIPAQESCTLP